MQGFQGLGSLPSFSACGRLANPEAPPEAMRDPGGAWHVK